MNKEVPVWPFHRSIHRHVLQFHTGMESVKNVKKASVLLDAMPGQRLSADLRQGFPTLLHKDIHAMLTLASGSASRQALLRNAGIAFQTVPARVDEEMVTEALLAEGHGPRSVADALAELKAMRVAMPGLVLGCDQTLDLDGTILGKPANRQAAVDMLTMMSGRTHKLHSAAVLADEGKAVWRHIADVTMVMRPLSQDYIQDYVSRSWNDIRHCAGAYMIEAEGARLFHQIRGDHFAVLGLPLLPLIDVLVTRGELAA